MTSVSHCAVIHSVCGGKVIMIDGIGNNKSILSFTAAAPTDCPAAVF